MCGIAGYSLGPKGSNDLPKWVQEHALGPWSVCSRLLLAALAERGADASGFAFSDGKSISFEKQSTPVSEFLPRVVLPAETKMAMMHVRDMTKGSADIEANNHPVEHGNVVCIHNGRISNDDHLFAELGITRQEPGMSVDSEAIALLADLFDPKDIAHRLIGSYATSFLDKRKPAQMVLLRGSGRPLHLIEKENSVWYASTREAMEWLADHFEWDRPKIERVCDGSGLILKDGKIVERFSFGVNHYVEKPFSGYIWDDERVRALRHLVLSSLHPQV